MVRQAYVNRLFLGRSAFDPPFTGGGEADEPISTQVIFASRRHALRDRSANTAQGYNSRGYPDNRESRRLSRRSRHAQNDVLTTIGVCVSVDEQDSGIAETRAPRTLAEREQARVVIEEHWYGSLLGSVTEIAGGASTWWIQCLRRRIQVSRKYEHASVASAIRADWNSNGKLSFFAPGQIPDITFHIVKAFVEGVLETLDDYFYLDRFNAFWARIPFHSDSVVKAASLLCRVCARTMPIIVQAQLDSILMLQKLHLLESWPPISTSMFSLALKLGPSSPTRWTASTALFFFRDSIISPYISLLVYNFAEEILRERLFVYAQTLALRPDNPDATSFRLELDNDCVDVLEATVLQLPIHQRSLKEQIALDYHSLNQLMLKTIYRTQEALRSIRRFYDVQHSVIPPESPRPAARPSTGRARLAESAHTVSFATDDQTLGRFGSENAEHEPFSHREPPSPDSNITPPQSPGGSSSGHLSDVDPSAVQVRTRSGSTSTLHMDLEVQLPANSQGVQERRHNSFTTSEQTLPLLKKPNESTPEHCRVTQLSVHSSTTMSVQMAVVLSSAILIPLESMCLRSLARAFLAAQGASAAQRSASVYPTMQFGWNRNSWKGMMAYSGQILVCFGLETAFRLYFWRICGSLSLWWGRTKFGWGHL